MDQPTIQNGDQIMGLKEWTTPTKEPDSKLGYTKARKERRSKVRIAADTKVRESKIIMEKSRVIFSRILGDDLG